VSSGRDELKWLPALFASTEARTSAEGTDMTGLEWILWIILVAFYICCIFTVCLLTFQKGHTLLGIVGIFIPLLWLVGAILPARQGSTYEARQRAVLA
jgi:hypothetical protein